MALPGRIAAQSAWSGAVGGRVCLTCALSSRPCIMRWVRSAAPKGDRKGRHGRPGPPYCPRKSARGGEWGRSHGELVRRWLRFPGARLRVGLAGPRVLEVQAGPLQIDPGSRTRRGRGTRAGYPGECAGFQALDSRLPTHLSGLQLDPGIRHPHRLPSEPRGASPAQRLRLNSFFQ